jgi:glycosyltransferase involved in cell wall biosynthesis
MSSAGSGQTKPPRDTANNFIKMVRAGQLMEMLKVLRRRLINTARFIMRVALRSMGIYYDSPLVRRRLLKKLLNQYYAWDKQVPNTPLRIGVVARRGTTYPSSSTFIRLLSPLTCNPIRQKAFISIHSPESVDTKNMDICIVLRTAYTYKSQAEKLVNNLKQKNAKLILDTDDAFHVLDTSHPEHHLHSQTLDAFNYIATNADQVWVSTNKLASELRAYGPKVYIVPNSLDIRLWGEVDNTFRYQSGPLQLLYMGTGTHDADFAMILPALESLSKSYPGAFQVTVIGVTDNIPDRDWLKRLHTKRNGSIYLRFVPWLLKQGPFDLGLAPLVDNDFNRNKSDIKCLDYLAAGIIPLVSDIEPYKNPELNGYIIRVNNSRNAWGEKLAELMANPENVRQMKKEIIPKAQKYIWDERASEKTARILLKNINELLNT